MQLSAQLKYLRLAPRKVRLVADVIRGKPVKEAQKILAFSDKKTALPLLKLLNSAIANAKHNFQLEEANLCIAKLLVNEGPRLKRWLPRSRGQAHPIQKKTSHIVMVLDEIKPDKEKKTKKIISEIKTAKKVIAKETVKKKPKTTQTFATKEGTRPKRVAAIKRVFKRKAF